MSDPRDKLETAVRWAREAGGLPKSMERDSTVTTKADGSQVTSVDLAIQEHILAEVLRAFPDHAVVAEEGTPTLSSFPSLCEARHCWVIDPLDGTRNYIRGLPCYATSIALLEDGHPLLGVVYEHNTDTVYSVARGEPPQCNGRVMRVSDRPRSRQSLVAVPSGKNERTGPVVRAWLDEMVLRNLGSTACHLALVAAGALDAAYCRECHVWDIAAGWLLVTAAGGVCTDHSGSPCFPMDLAKMGTGPTPFLAGSPQVHRALLSTLPRS